MSVRDRIKLMEQMAKKEEEAAAERGRSPGGVSSVRSNASDSPRPLSKVRTSFVAIEKDGRIGLQRQPSGDSSISGSKLSGGPETASTILQDHTRTNIASPDATRPEFNRGPASSSVSPSSVQDTAGPTLASAARPPLPETQSTAGAAVVEPRASAPPAALGPQNTTTKGLAATSAPTGPTSGRREGLAEPAQIRQAPRGAGVKAAGEGAVQPVSDEAQDKDHGSKGHLNSNGGSAGGSAPIAVAAAVNGAGKAKTTTPAATVKSPPPSSQPKPATKAPESTPKPAVKAPESTPKRDATPPPEKPAKEKKTPSTVSPSGFVKPRPKSPTRPVKLPASLTTHTAASGQKTKNGAPPPVQQPTRTAKAIARSSSAASPARPSIGPPPKQTAKDHPVPKKEVRAPDESFLARMMRPTQASANKVADKVANPTTPPRKTVTATAARKPPSGKAGPTKRVVSRTMPSAMSDAGTADKAKKEEPSSVKVVAKKVEQTPSAEEAVTVAKKAERISEEKTEAPKTIGREPAVNEEKKSEVKAIPETTEKKEDGPRPSEKKDEITRAPVQENISKPQEIITKEPELENVKSSEKKENAPTTFASIFGAAKASDEDDIPEEFKPRNLDAKPVEKTEAGSKSPPKASNAFFAAFMSGAGKTDGPQANGTHKLEDKTVEQGSQAQPEEQEEW